MIDRIVCKGCGIGQANLVATEEFIRCRNNGADQVETLGCHPLEKIDAVKSYGFGRGSQVAPDRGRGYNLR